MNELLIRTIVAIVMAAVALIAAFLGGYVFAILVAIAAGAMFVEWRRLTEGWGPGWMIAGFAYALLPALALLWLRDRAPQGLELLYWVFIVSWSTDIGAYFAGRAIGGPKLAPSISPNKTWAGLIGGMVSAALAGWAWTQYVMLPLSLIWLAPVFAAAAQGGDLFESWLKRRGDAKDSGSMLPGHGGILDRLDGLVVVATLTALFQLGGIL
ncbi:MAG: phosphatidate cytidylyltransferase [Sphingomonas bacterium]|nr:phosphatidate cytidylyltransferase [Sphingomonas bacterium]